MSCSLTQGYTPKNCKTVSGTISVMLAEFANVTGVTYSNGIVTAISMASGKQFFEYKQKAEVANWKSTPTIDAKSQAYKYEHAITLDIADVSSATMVESDNLMKNTLLGITKDNDGTYWMFGVDFGLDVTALPWDGGIEMSSFRGGKLEVKGMSAIQPLKVTEALIADLLLPASP